jgi:hypothetical protein
MTKHVKERPPDWLIHDKWHPKLGSKMLVYRRNLFRHMGHMSSFDFRNSAQFLQIHKGRDDVSCTAEVKEAQQMRAYSQTLHPCVASSGSGDDDLKVVLKKLNEQFRGDVLKTGGAAAAPRAARASEALSAKLQEALQLHRGALGVARRGASCAEHCSLSSLVCVERLFPLLNLCSALKMRMTCATCDESVGADQPAMVESADSFDAQLATPSGRCLVNQLSARPPHASTCAGKHSDTRRLCLCFPSAAAAAHVQV